MIDFFSYLYGSVSLLLEFDVVGDVEILREVEDFRGEGEGADLEGIRSGTAVAPCQSGDLRAFAPGSERKN